MTVKEFLNRYDNKEEFDEDELHELFNGDLEEEDDDTIIHIDHEEDEDRRWSRFETNYFCFNNRYFACCGDIGLTEYQDNCYYTQPTEVKRTQKTITTVVNVWEEIKRDSNS